MLQSQAMAEMFPGEAQRGAICGILNAIEQEEEDEDEIASIVKTIFQAKAKAAKRRRVAPKVWPEGYMESRVLKAMQPPGGTAWYDPALRRYQAFYRGGSLSRALRLYTPNGAAKRVTQWAWTCHAMLGNDIAYAPVGLFDDDRVQ